MFYSRTFWKIYLGFILFIALSGVVVGIFVTYQTPSVRFAAICVGIFLALLFGFFLARQIVSPLKRINDFAAAIAAGDFEKRISVGKDEFGQLGRSLNSMAAQITEDISRREQAEKSLRKSEQYQNLFKHANDAILIFEPENETVLNVNDKACEMYGLSREEFVGSSLKERSNNVARGSEELEKLLHDGVYEEFESVHLRGDGTPLDLVINAVVIEYENQSAIMTINRNVSQRKRLEEDLRERERHLLSVTNSARDAIVSADNRGNIIFWNEGARNIFGYEEREVIGKPLSILMPEKYREAHAKGMRRHIETGENRVIGQAVELEGLRQDGSEFPLELSLGVWETANGKYFTGIMRDITERQAAANALKEREENYRLLGEGIMHQVWTSLPDGKLDYVNQRTLDYFGFSMGQAINDGWMNVVHPDDLSLCVKRWTRSLETGEDYEVEFRLKRADGAYLWHLGRAAAGRDAAGGIVKWFGTNSDIQTQKTAEEKLRDSEAWLRAIFDGSRDGILIENNVKIIYVNNSYAELLGYAKPEELIGGSIADILPPDEAERLGEYGRRRLQGENVLSVYEFKSKRKDGTLVDVEGSVSTTIIGGKKYIMTAVRDITGRKQIREELQKNVSLLSSTFEATADGILAVGSDNKIVAFNEKFARMWGMTAEELNELDSADAPARISSQIKKDEEYYKRTKRIDLQKDENSFDVLELKDGRILERYSQPQKLTDKIVGRVFSFRDITERRRAEDRLLHDAFHDGLTGIANRALFMDHLQRAIERGKSRHSNFYAVLFLDFDRFKVINDSLGHGEGDNFLKLAARRLEHSTRTGDLVARLGGDEFVVLLNELLEAGDAIQIAERIQEDLKKPFDLGGREIFASASIGVIYSTAGHTRAEDMLRDADIAMYDAKAKGRANYQIFDKEMHNRATRRLEIETEMRQALERKEFCVHYQPIIDIETENLMGFESLIRWKHPERGMIPPFEFIPVAEENNLILPIGNWILRESCRQLREWQNAYPAASDLTISVNLSCKEFLQTDLVEQINETLRQTGLNPHCLKLEITESHVMENSETAVTMMNRLRSLGVQISLDDFGTGYSSLSYLHRLPVNFLKIDRSFVMRMAESIENEEIVHTIIKLAQNLKMKVIAEGVETAEQLARLKQMKCEYVQGYFFSKPLETEQARLFIEKSAKNLTLPKDQPIINLDNLDINM